MTRGARGDELAVSSVYVQPPAELLVEAIAVYRAAYALAKQQQEEYDGEPTLKFAWAVAGDFLLEFIARRERYEWRAGGARSAA